jgi:hypothetical protein
MGRLVVNILITGLISALTAAHAGDDAYLKMLEGEAANVQLDHSGQLQKQENEQTQVRKVFEWKGELKQQDSVPKGLDREQFDAFLQENFYGTYVFYSKLNTTDRDTVYYRYSKAEEPDLENVRKNVMALLKQ